MPYNNGVLIGNWSEERLQNEFEFKVFLRKRDRHELLIQRSRILYSNLLMERPLAISGAIVRIGFQVQVIASDMPAQFGGGAPHYGLALSTLVTEKQVDYTQNISEGCVLTLSPITAPCCRNTFTIVSGHHDVPHGANLKYGDDFLLQAANYGNPTAPPLYVRFHPPSPAIGVPMHLSTNRDCNCLWSVLPLHKKDIPELLGSAVPTGAKLVLKHCAADQGLCVLNQNWRQTFFGPECGVTCKNCYDIHKRVTAENIFILASDVKTKTKD